MAFGSTRDPSLVDTVLFVNCPFPVMTRDAVDPREVTVYPHYRYRKPCATRSLFNVPS